MPLPAVLGRERGAQARFTLFLDPAHPAFRGHFPGDPVLPGLVQVDWAIRLGTEAFGDPGPFRALERLRFLEALRPGETVELRITPAPESFAFEYRRGEGKVSSGTARFGGRP